MPRKNRLYSKRVRKNRKKRRLNSRKKTFKKISRGGSTPSPSPSPVPSPRGTPRGSSPSPSPSPKGQRGRKYVKPSEKSEVEPKTKIEGDICSAKCILGEGSCRLKLPSGAVICSPLYISSKLEENQERQKKLIKKMPYKTRKEICEEDTPKDKLKIPDADAKWCKSAEEKAQKAAYNRDQKKIKERISKRINEMKNKIGRAHV